MRTSGTGKGALYIHSLYPPTPYRFLPVATTKPPQSHLQNFIQQLLSSLVEIYRLLHGILYAYRHRPAIVLVWNGCSSVYEHAVRERECTRKCCVMLPFHLALYLRDTKNISFQTVDARAPFREFVCIGTKCTLCCMYIMHFCCWLHCSINVVNAAFECVCAAAGECACNQLCSTPIAVLLQKPASGAPQFL